MVIIYFRDSSDLKKLCKKYADGFELINYQIGYDGKVYMLCSRENFDVYEYRMITAEVDWSSEKIISDEFTELGEYPLALHFIQPIGENVLLLGGRARRYEDGSTDKNAVFFDRNGNTVRELCFGDGIGDCITTEDGRIFVGYFDEGVFGNYGWDDPIGKHGLLEFDEYGDINWRSCRPICDCYAMNVDDAGELWYYYYTDFLLIKTDLFTEQVFDPNISGADSFLISSDGSGIIINGGYDKQDEFFAAKIIDGSTSSYDFVKFSYGKNEIHPISMRSLGSKAVFEDSGGRLYFKQIKKL